MHCSHSLRGAACQGGPGSSEVDASLLSGRTVMQRQRVPLGHPSGRGPSSSACENEICYRLGACYLSGLWLLC